MNCHEKEGWWGLGGGEGEGEEAGKVGRTCSEGVGKAEVGKHQ